MVRISRQQSGAGFQTVCGPLTALAVVSARCLKSRMRRFRSRLGGLGDIEPHELRQKLPAVLPVNLLHAPR
jgi:hypothetical protein